MTQTTMVARVQALATGLCVGVLAAQSSLAAGPAGEDQRPVDVENH